MLDVLIANPCGRTGEIVRDSLSSHGLDVLVVEGPNARKFPDFFIKTLKRHEARMILPVFFPEVLAARRDEFPAVTIPLADASLLRRLDNKISACALAAELGICQPRIYPGPDAVDRFPTVLKRPDGQGGDSVYFPKTATALRNLMKTAGEVLLTEYIEGDDVCVDAIRWDGYFQAAAYKVLWPRRKGVSRLRIGIDAPQLCESLHRILDAVSYNGVCGADFRIDASGKAYFLECNPRFSGGLESAIASGFDIPWVLWQLANGQTPEPVRLRHGVMTGDLSLKDNVDQGVDK